MVKNTMEKNKAGKRGSGSACVCVCVCVCVSVCLCRCETVIDISSEVVRKEVQDGILGRVASAGYLGLTVTI